MRRKVSRKSVLIGIGGILIFFVSDLACRGLLEHYTVGVAFPGMHTEGYCLPWRVYLIRKNPRHALARGDLIAFVGDERMPKSFQGRPVAKLVIGVPGDHIEIRDDWVWINGEPYDRMWLAAGKGIRKDFVVEDGHYFVVGTHKNAVDSRYFGVIDARAVIGPARPLF